MDQNEFAYTQISNLDHRADGYVQKMTSLSADYALLGVRSALVLNGGALFAAPPYLAAILSGKEMELATGHMVWASLWFVCGIVAAALCCLVAYLNFQWNSKLIAEMFGKERSRLEEEYDVVTYHQLRNYRLLEQERSKAESEKLEQLASLSYGLGVALALFSYAFFVLGCYSVGAAFGLN